MKCQARSAIGAAPLRDDAMAQPLNHHDFDELGERLREAPAITPELISAVVYKTCRRFPTLRQSARADQIERLIRSGAWLDAVLALIDLETPQWQVRRIAYDDGEWQCALSRERELPDWLDQSVEARHPDLALAVLGAFFEVQRLSRPTSRTSVPAVSPEPGAMYEPVCSDNFG